MPIALQLLHASNSFYVAKVPTLSRVEKLEIIFLPRMSFRPRTPKEVAWNSEVFLGCDDTGV